MAPVISKAYAMGKEKRVDEAYETLLPFFERNELPGYFREVAGWTIYRYVKAHFASLLPSQASAILGYYLHVCQHEPDMLHSYIMVVAVNYKKQHMQEFPFASFCRSWGLDTFRDEDYLPAKASAAKGTAITYQSLAVKVATCLYKELKQRQAPDAAREFLPFFDTLLAKCPDYEYTSLYIANLHAWCGEKDAAIAMFKGMLATNPQWYQWKHLGDLLEARLKISCYCKALTMMAKEEYVGGIHLALAGMLRDDDPQQAACELEKYASTYKRNGWRMKAEAYELENALKGVTPSPAGNAFYAKNTSEAEDYAYGDLPQDEFVYTGKRPNSMGKMRACLENRAKRLHIKSPLTPLLMKASIGSVFLCRYRLVSNRPILLSAHATRKKLELYQKEGKRPRGTGEAEAREVEGLVKIRDGQPFAFVGNYYIPPSLRQSAQLTNGQRIRAKVVCQPDGRWRAVKISVSKL